MARRHRIDILCDLCQAEDIETEAEETEPVTIGKGRALMLGLCKQHMPIYEAFRDALRDYGQPYEDETSLRPQSGSKTTKTPPSPEFCKVCGKEYKYTGSLRHHVKEEHNMTLGEMRASTGQPEPAQAPKVQTAVCDVPGCTSGEDGGPMTYAWPEFTRPAQALGIHKRRAHDLVGTTKTSINRAKQKAAKAS